MRLLPSSSLLLLVACAPSAERAAPPRVVRPALVPVGAFPARPARGAPLVRLAPPTPADLTALRAEIRSAEATRPRRDKTTHVLRVRPRGGARLSLPGPFDPTLVDRVVVRLASEEQVRLQLFARIDGRDVLASERSYVRTVKAPRAVTLELPTLQFAQRPIDALEIELTRVPSVEIHEIQVLHDPAWTRLPEPGAVELVRFGRDARRATALSDCCPLATTFTPRAGDVLELSFGAGNELRHPGLEPRLRVTLEARAERGTAGPEPTSETFEVGSGPLLGPAWRRAELDLDDFAGRLVSATFELLDEDPARESWCALGEPRVVSPAPEAPTVVLVTSDTHRADHLGAAHAGVAVDTPFLDALAARGVLFEDAHAACNNTTPSHAALLSGVHPRDTAIVSNAMRVSDDVHTLAETFHAAGWLCYGAVSVRHLGDQWGGFGQGFDHFSEPLQGQRDSQETIDDLASWLPDAAGRPLFVWLHVFDAHSPYAAPDEYAQRQVPEGLDPRDPTQPGADPTLAPLWAPELVHPDYIEAMYRAEVEYLDAQLARLFADERLGNGVVAFTADHGENLRDGVQPYEHRGLSVGTLAVPLVLCWPDAPGGMRVQRPVSQIDLGRTVLDLAGLAHAPFPGANLLAEGGEARPRFAIEANGVGASIQSGRWMLDMRILLLPEYPGELHRARLFDNDADPEHTRDLALVEPERAARMRRELVAWLCRPRVADLSAAPRVESDEVESALGALGYAGSADAPETSWIDPECRCTWCAPAE